MRTFVLVDPRRRPASGAAPSTQRRIDLQPRIERNRTYAMVRAWATVIQRDLQMYALIADIYAGRPVAYTTFLGYDEVAHHSGIERPETLEVLRDVDRHIDRLIARGRATPRAPTSSWCSPTTASRRARRSCERYGKTLEELVRELRQRHGRRPKKATRARRSSTSPRRSSEVAAGDSAGATVVRRATRGRSSDGEVHLGVDSPAVRRGGCPRSSCSPRAAWA